MSAARGLLLLATLVVSSSSVACNLGENDPPLTPNDVPLTGDPNPDGAAPGAVCEEESDCRSGVCVDELCRTATNTDGVRNGDETDIDCGGAAGPACANGKSCLQNENCSSRTCVDFTCVEPTIPCTTGDDCESGYCESGICKVPESRDGIQNGGETGIDCGGTHPEKCPTDQRCLVGADCLSKVCSGTLKRCAAPTFDDKTQNGTETDVDCGGPGAPKLCKPGKKCVAHSDCESNGCSFDKTCAMGASCTQLEGGQTCGPTEGMTKQNDCCDRAKVGAYTIDKYLITAGRMRAFLERHEGKVRDWAATLPANKWSQAWTAKLPNSIEGEPGSGDNANTQLGPFFGKRSCQTGYHTGHTFWTPPIYGDTKDFPKDVLDTKALNCVPWWLLSALCVFDGGHLLTQNELRAAYTNGNTTSYPWGARGTYTTNNQNDYAIQRWSYVTPNTPPTAGQNPSGFLDAAFYVAPPGRRPAGYNQTAHTDLVGNLLEWVGDSERQFVWKGSFEDHAREADAAVGGIDHDPYWAMRTTQIPWRWHDIVANAADPTNVNGYYALGGRCGY